MTPTTPCPKTCEPYFAAAIRVDEKYHCKLSCKPTSSDICTVCPDAGKVPCPVCRLVQYCSEECLKRDLPIHWLFCKSFWPFRAIKRPFAMGIRCHRAILIPENDSPRWTWVRTTPDLLFYYLDHLYGDLPYMGLRQRAESVQLGYHSIRVPKHGIIATMRCQSTRGENMSSLNKFLQCQGPSGHLGTVWGPVIVLAFKAGDPAKCTDPWGLLGCVEDLEMADVAHVFHTLVHNNPENPCVVDVSRFAHKTIPAVKINCLGDRRRFHTNKNALDDAAIYEAVIVPNVVCHPSIQWPSISAFMLGLPWACRAVCSSRDFWVKAGPNDEGEWIPDGDSLRNTELGCLPNSFRGPGRAEFVQALVPARIDRNDNPGTVLILHMYGEVISVEHIKMFWLFCEETDVMNLWYKPQQVVRVFHEAAFREFWGVKKKENAIPGMDLSEVPSPYAWQKKAGRENSYLEYSQELEKYERLLKQAATDSVILGYTPSSRPIFASASTLSFEQFQKQLGNNPWSDESCNGG